jgi:hypothetical protein
LESAAVGNSDRQDLRDLEVSETGDMDRDGSRVVAGRIADRMALVLRDLHPVVLIGRTLRRDPTMPMPM